MRHKIPVGEGSMRRLGRYRKLSWAQLVRQLEWAERTLDNLLDMRDAGDESDALCLQIEAHLQAVWNLRYQLEKRSSN